MAFNAPPSASWDSNNECRFFPSLVRPHTCWKNQIFLGGIGQASAAIFPRTSASVWFFFDPWNNLGFSSTFIATAGTMDLPSPRPSMLSSHTTIPFHSWRTDLNGIIQQLGYYWIKHQMHDFTSALTQRHIKQTEPFTFSLLLNPPPSRILPASSYQNSMIATSILPGNASATILLYWLSNVRDFGC
jgi:hypothetical protein